MGRAWQRAGWLLLLPVLVTLTVGSAGLYGFLGATALLGLLLLVGFAIWLVLLLLSKLSRGTRWGMLVLAVPVVATALFVPRIMGFLYLLLLLLVGLLAAGVERQRRSLKTSGTLLQVAGGVPLVLGAVGFLLVGWSVHESPQIPPMTGLPLSLDNPGLPGSHTFTTLSYGSGEDAHRPEFAAAADWRSQSVDGSKLLEGWDGPAGWARSGYWGVEPDSLPVQGRVWLPDGEGPFPMVLIVHGNHKMADYSDVGYAYLGEQFASRGFLTVSVDENFLNSSLSDLLSGPDGGLEEESDARAWMLLMHLVQWREWSADPDHVMHGKADLERVALIGHSRGGEAVSEAVVFNRLPRYPDDGTLAFEFNFGIRGVIAIAPVDHQYHPRDLDTPLNDVNYLVVHGSHDSDVDAFAGSATYSRLAFDGCEDCFKTSFYLLDANHGQFNTAWGRYDAGFPAARLLNVTPLLDGEDQRTVAVVLFSAFLEKVLHGRDEYQQFLAQPERGAHWLPEGASWLSNYGDGRQVPLASFEEDADLTTGSKVRIEGSGLQLWKEAQVPLRWRDLDSAAVLVGWNGVAGGEPPAYELSLGEDTFWLTPEMTLSVGVAMGTQAPEGAEEFEVPESLDFTIELVDAGGERAGLSLNERRLLHPQVDPVLYKLDWLDGGAASEVVFQRYAFRISDWMAANVELDISAIRQVRFLFPQEVPASVWLDDILISPDGF